MLACSVSAASSSMMTRTRYAIQRATLGGPVRGGLLAQQRLPVRALSASTTAVASVEGAPGSASRLVHLLDAFRYRVDATLPKDGKGVVFATAWLASDNVFVALMRKHYPEILDGMGLLSVDTLHLFPETYEVAACVQAKYGKAAAEFKPLAALTRADFETKYGHCEVMHHADFDLHSKVEPYQRGLKVLGRDILVTGRRMDQGEKRVSLDEWESQTRTLNPLAQWTWPDITAFVDAHDVPVNGAHNYVFRAAAPIDPKQRHLPSLPWTRVDLGKPFWRASEGELKGSPPAPLTYVLKSFGDTHTTVPVLPHESERTGRFVRLANTECGIHTRTARPGFPHGGKLVDRFVHSPEERAELVRTATRTLPLTERQSCDVELLVNGALSPLEGFMGCQEYDSVVETGRLPEQQLFTMPIVLDSNLPVGEVGVGERVALQYKGEVVAVLDVTSVWQPDKVKEAAKVFGTTSLEHPGVAELATQRGHTYIGGTIHGIAQPKRDITCASPRQVRAALPPSPTPVVAFQCRNPIHKAHFELVKRSLTDVAGATVLVHPTVGPTQPGDIDGTTRVATYKALEAEVGQPRIQWAFLPLNMRMAGPREAIHHMIVRKNFGCTHFIVGRDMAGTKSTITGKDFYGPYDAQETARSKAGELAMEVVTFENMVYTDQGYAPESVATAAGLAKRNLSGTEFRRLLRAGEPIPEWFAFSSVIQALREGEKMAATAGGGTAAVAQSR